MKKGFTLAEIMITLIIIGVIAAITIPNFILKWENKKNIVVLKIAYGDLHKFLYKFIQENGCYTLSSCAPNSGEFNIKFVNYLIEKHGFKNIVTNNGWHTIPGHSADYCRIDLNYSNGKAISADAHCLMSPSKKYGYRISGFPCDSATCNYGDKKIGYARAYIDIFTEPKLFKAYFGGVFPKDVKYNQWGKNIFRVAITNKARILPNGSEYNAYRHIQSLSTKPCDKENGFITCFQQVINDGWKIKYSF